MAIVTTGVDRATNFEYAVADPRVAKVIASPIFRGEKVQRAIDAAQQAEHSQAVLAMELTSLGRDAVPLSATVTVLAGPAGTTFLGDVAIVRAEGSDPSASSKVHVVDFQGLRVVSGVDHPSGVTVVDRWQAPAFQRVAAGAVATGSFPDVQSDRLRLTLTSPESSGNVAKNGTVVLLSPPADLQLTVAGAQIWSHPGPVRPTEADGVTFRHDVVLTPRQVADLKAAVAAAPGPPPALVLWSSVPGRIRLEASIPHRRILDLPFPEGPERPVPFVNEGSVTLPLVIASTARKVAVVRATLRAPDAGTARVLPPVGPKPSPAQVLLDRDRAVVVGIPGRSRAALAVLHGVRVHVVAGPGGAELGAFLRADVPPSTGSGRVVGAGPTTPGELLPDASMGPVTLPPGSEVGAWVTLPLAQPRPLDSDGELWLELRVSRGTAAWQLAQPITGDGVDASVDALVRRALPSGDFRALSPAWSKAPAGERGPALPVPTGSGLLRVVGEPPPDRPIPILDLDVDVGSGAVPGLARSVTPTPDGVEVEVILPSVGAPQSLSLTAFAPLDLTVGHVSVEHL